jgi:phosphoribosylamine--glycine ligase
MRVLLLGGGGREHALGWKLASSPKIDLLISCPGNPGLAEIGDTEPSIDPNDPAAVVNLARDRDIDFVVVGPEAPLAAGVADALISTGIAVFGPPASGAMLETSKSFAKDVMAAAGVPTAGSSTFTSTSDAYAHLADAKGPYVVKADGLAAGKGVLVTESLERANRWVDECIDGRFGGEGAAVVIEEFLDGEELSVFFICADGKALPFEPARDYKRLADGDTGPNTGGMGSYSPVTDLPDDLLEWTREHVAEPTLAELGARGIDYVGFLYVGLMLTKEGPKVVEFNCRLGDPETQALMPRLKTDLLEALYSATTTGLTGVALEWRKITTVNVVIASKGYPDAPTTGYEVRGLSDITDDDVIIFHAGTQSANGRVVTAGGRVLSVVGIGSDVETARARSYEAITEIEFTGKQFRSDIGL